MYSIENLNLGELSSAVGTGQALHQKIMELVGHPCTVACTINGKVSLSMTVCDLLANGGRQLTEKFKNILC